MNLLYWVRKIFDALFIKCWRMTGIQAEWEEKEKEITRHASRIATHGFLVRTIERTFYYLQYVSPAGLFGIPPPHVQEVYSAVRKNRNEANAKRAGWVDRYLAGWWILEFVILGLILFWCDHWTGQSAFFWIVRIIIAVRVFDLVVTTINQNILNYFRYDEAKTSFALRNLIIVFINFFEVSFIFGLLYLTHNSGIRNHLNVPIHGVDVFYFSLMSQMTVGYGDWLPIDLSTKFLMMIQMCLSFLITVIVIGRLLPSLIPVHDAFQEDRVPDDSIGKIRTELSSIIERLDKIGDN
ncbi:MAG: ion channel [Candidatus Kapaibacterium sp.]